MAAASNLAASLSGQGKHADEERIEREVLDVSRRVLASGEEHPNTLTSAGSLAASLSAGAKGSTLTRSGSSGRY